MKKLILISVVLGVASFQSGAHAADYLSEELNAGTTIEVTLDELTRELSTASVIAIGESHATGYERDALRDLYLRLGTVLGQRLPCLVEDVQTSDGTSPNLIDQDVQLLPAANQVCSGLQNVAGNSPSATTFRRSLANAFATSNQVITHSGFRHILAFGRLYPNEFKPARVDITEANTIVDQLPSSVARRGNVVSVSYFNRDELPILYLAGRVTEIVQQPSSGRSASVDSLMADVRRVFGTPRLTSSGNAGDVHFYSTDRLNRGSNPSRKNYVALVDQKVFDLNRLVTFLSSAEVRAYIAALPARSPVYASLVTVPQLGFGTDLLVDRGGLFIFGRGGYAAIHPDGRIQVRMPTPTN